MSKRRIGFLSYWGVGRGLAAATLNFVKMIKDDYDIYILQQFENTIGKEYQLPNINVEVLNSYIVPVEVFKDWITRNKLDAVVFNEYNQWQYDPQELVKVAKDMGCRTYAELVMERFQPDQVKYYDRLFMPTVTFQRVLRNYKVRNFSYIPFSIDLNEFPKEQKDIGTPFIFFHPGGFGGVHNRKNTQIVIDAFLKLNNTNTKLIITSQKPISFTNLPENIEIIDKNMDREELIRYYYKAHATILPSKWETIGIPILESLAAGTPVITSNAPPMNEFIRPGLNGYICTGNTIPYEGISVLGIEVDSATLKKAMENILNPTVYPMLCKNSRYIIEQLYDQQKNKHYLLDFLKNDLK